MSKPRNKWWSYVKWMIRLYPMRVEELSRRQAATVTPNYSAMPKGSDPSRTTENLGTISLGNPADREMDAVRLAIEDTLKLKDGNYRMILVDLVFWRKTHTLNGAALELHTSERTAERWHNDFIHQVAKNFGLE